MTALVADIGGTNARFALLDGDAPVTAIRERRSLKNDDHRTAGAAIEAYLDMVGRPALDGACLSVAGPVVDGAVAMTNRGWRISEVDLADQLGTARTIVQNDFEALAWSLGHLEADDCRTLLAGDAVPDGTRVVLGPGTGLGVAALARGADGRTQVVTSEAGHINVGVPSAAFLPVLERVFATRPRIMAEDLLSGPGLRRLHGAVKADGASELVEAEIETLARAGTDDACVRAVALFFEALAAFARDMALAFNADGGVYLCGGVLEHLHDLMPHGLLEAVFRSQPEPLLQHVPVLRIQTANAALVGAAARLRVG